MEQMLYDAYANILREELIPAMGCTEPIAQSVEKVQLKLGFFYYP